MSTSPIVRKKLIEVALPLDAINAASALEKQPFTRKHPRSIHIWWARRPFVAARAVIFAQMVDDPSSWPDLFPTEKAQEKERQRLFRIIEDLAKWENTSNEAVLQSARDAIWESWRRACAENANHPQARELFDRQRLPAFHDPFAGGGALPLEAQRLGLESFASDLNPVAVLINKAMIEIPSRFANRPPVNPATRSKRQLIAREWRGVEGMAEDIRYYGQWVRDEAEKRIGHLYPKAEITASMVKARPDLKQYAGKKLTVIAWLWARTVKSPNPAFANIDVPLISTFMLCSKPGKEAFIDPVIEGTTYSFVVRTGKPEDLATAMNGTKLGRGANFRCLLSGSPIAGDYIKSEGRAGRMGMRLIAIVAEGNRGRVYLPPIAEHELAAKSARPTSRPETEIAADPRALWTPLYGLTTYGHLFTDRQIVALTTLTELVQAVAERACLDASGAGFPDDKEGLHSGGGGITAYGEAVGVYMGLATSRWSDMSNALCSWNSTNQNVRALFARQGIPMAWDFVELSPFSSVGPWFSAVESISEASSNLAPCRPGLAVQADAAQQTISSGKVVSTDPPYFDNIGYADLSDFFYVWLRQSLKAIYPELFGTLAVPKSEELVASPYRHGGKDAAEAFFMKGMSRAMQGLAEQTHPAFPVTIYYAFKQAETDKGGTASTGWETFLDALVRAGFTITGTWPMRTEREVRSTGLGTNALASSIILVCRRRPATASTATRREFITALTAELPVALAHLQRGNIAPVDLAQAAIGPGMGVYTRYVSVLDAAGAPLSVREALALINQTLDEVLAEQEGDFDSDTRWALAWFDQVGFNDGAFGEAETLSKAKVTSVQGMVQAGIVEAGAGKVRLLRPSELPADWDPENDPRLTVWEAVHHLVRALEAGGESAAAEMVRKLGSHAETARELAYRLFTLCERRKRPAEALSYNALVQSWPEIARLAREQSPAKPTQGELF